MPPKPALSHFLCIPLVTSTSRPQLQKTLNSFKEKVTKTRTAELPDGIPEKAVRPVGTLHLTLGVMSLLTPERVEGALKVLKELNLKQILTGITPANTRSEAEKSTIDLGGKKISASEEIPPPISIALQGLRGMQEASKTSVLYTSPLDPDLRLYRFCQKLRDIFGDFLVQDSRPLLLHATIVNTIYVPRRKEKGGHRRKDLLKLDVRELLLDYEEFMWMEGVRVEKVAICKMGAKVQENGEEEYVVEGDVEMPR